MVISILALSITAFLCFLFGILTIQLLSLITQKVIHIEDFDPSLVFWLGLITICWLLMILSFFIKISMLAFLLITFLGILLSHNQIQGLRLLIKGIKWKWTKFFVTTLTGILFIFFVLSKSTNPILNYDTGLYHIQNIKWIETYPIIQGLGNLHGRFAFNSNWFLLSALFGYLYFLAQRVYILNIFITCLTGLFLLNKIASLTRQKTNSGLFSVLVFIYSLISIYQLVNSPSTDLPANLILWILLILFMEKIERATLTTWDLRSWTIFLLAILGFTIKVSTATNLIIPAFLLLISIRRDWRILWQVLLTGSLFFIPWVIRNIILSGTIIYPVSFLHLPWFDWSIPVSKVNEMARIIRAWAMMPRMDSHTVLSLPFSTWFMEWVIKRSYEELILLLVTIIGIIQFFLLDGFYLLKKRLDTPSFFFLDGFFLLSLLYWFATAPDPRFAYGLLIASFMYFVMRMLKPVLSNQILIKSLQYIALLCVSILAIKILSQPALQQNILYPPSVPIADTETLTLLPDLMILSPTKNDQCWDAPLPCSKTPDPSLSLRGINFADGFRSLPDP